MRRTGLKAWRKKLDHSVEVFIHGAFVMADGGHLCHKCLVENFARCRNADVRCPDDEQWTVIGCDQPSGQQCDNCWEPIGESR
jgi:hypothetical protein